MSEQKVLSLLALCALCSSPGFAQTIVTSNWTCTTGDWGISGCWDVLGGTDTEPDNSASFLYDVTLPTTGGAYTISVTSSSISCRKLDVEPLVTLRLDSTNFAPGILTNLGVIEVRNDDLYFDDDIINDGNITFDPDVGSETIEVREPSLVIGGTGSLTFPDVPGGSTSTHRLLLPNLETTTNDVGHLIHGGPGQIRGGNNFPTDLINDGTIRADTPGMTLEVTDFASGNVLRVINGGELAATSGARLEFDDIAEIINNGIITCDAASEIFLNATTTDLSGTLLIDGLLNSNTNLTIDGASGIGAGELYVTGDLTFAGGTSAEFGTVNHNSGGLMIENGAALTFNARYTHTLTSESAYDLLPGSMVVAVGGTAAAPNDYLNFSSFEVAGRDVGDIASGYTSNFNVPHLVIGPGAKVNLFDAVNNGNRGGSGGNAEALYVGTVEFLDGAGRINLNGHHLYYSNLIGSAGQIVDNGGGSGKGFTPTWTCGSGSWSTTECWSGLAGADIFPDNSDFIGYDVILPAGSPYDVMVDVGAGSVEVTSMSISSDATLTLLSTNFSPNLLINDGIVEINSDELILSQSIINNGTIEFDLDTSTESISLERSLSILGTGSIVFPNISSSAPQHSIDVPNGGTLTIGPDQTVSGGPGGIGGGTSSTTDVVVEGTVLANTPGKSIEFADDDSDNLLEVTNDGLIRAENGGIVTFDDIAAIHNNSEISCDAASFIVLSTTIADLGGTLMIDGRLEADSALTLVGATGMGSGVLSTTAQTNFTGATDVSFGVVDHNDAGIMVEAGSMVTVTEAYTHSLTSESSFEFKAGSALLVTGGAAAMPTEYEDFASIEIAGRDDGDTAGGYTSNFDLPHLIIGSGAKVNLFDAVDNGNRGGAGGNAEALYVGTVEFLDGAGLINLNGHHLYYGSLVGSPGQIIDNGGGSGKSFSPAWTCSTGTWSTTGCWSALSPGDLFPSNSDFLAYDVLLGAGTPYTVIVDLNSGSVKTTSLTISADATVELLSTNFAPGQLMNDGVLQISNDDLLLTQDVTNNGVIQFDTDTGSEDIFAERSIDVTGTGTILYPDVSSTSTSLHTFNVPNLGDLRIGPDQLVRGGPGEFRGGSSFPTDVINDGEIRAEHPGKRIRFNDLTTSNVMRVTNNGLMHATTGGEFEFDDIWGIVNNGTLMCDAGSVITFTTTTTDIGGTVIVDGLMEATNSLTFDGAVGSGGGTLDVTNSLTLSGDADIEFGRIESPQSLIVNNGSTLNIRDEFAYSITSEVLFNFNSSGALRMTGGSGLDPCDPGMPATLEVAGEDEGDVGSGFTSNFEIERLIIAPGANVMLVDNINNGNRDGAAGSAEALYVDELIFEDTTGRIILNGLHLYYNSITGAAGQLEAGDDCNTNGQLDACDIGMGVSLDCNANGIPDECDIASGFSPDCDMNGVPDECELGIDCNTNGVPDDCDIAIGSSLDLNGNSIPDECENDCNSNGTPDDVDILVGNSEDCDLNGIPDECQGGFMLFTWIGSDGGNWAFQPNWSPLGPPLGDAVLDNPMPGAMTTLIQSPTAASVCSLNLSSTGGGHALEVRSGASLFAEAFAIGSGGTLKPTGGDLDGATINIAIGGAVDGYGEILNDVINNGMVASQTGQTLRLAGSLVLNNANGVIDVAAGSVLDVAAATVVHNGTLRVHANGTAGIDAGLNATSGAMVELLGGTLATPTIQNDSISTVTGFGVLDTPAFANDGQWIVIDDSQATGDVTNEGTITVQSGTLLIVGSLTGAGSVIGDVSSRGGPAPHGLFVAGDIAPSAGAVLHLPDAGARLAVGGHLDLVSTDFNDIDLETAAVQMAGLSTQTLEAMSVDIGATDDGLMRAAGHFPIGALRIGPTLTTVTIVDARDNDGMGQGVCEAVYVGTLTIDAGATLNNDACPVYYQALVQNGTVSNPANLIRIAPACPGDANASGTVDFTDLNIVLVNWATAGPDGDLDGNGSVDFSDLNEVLANWGTMCP